MVVSAGTLNSSVCNLKHIRYKCQFDLTWKCSYNVKLKLYHSYLLKVLVDLINICCWHLFKNGIGEWFETFCPATMLFPVIFHQLTVVGKFQIIYRALGVKIIGVCEVELKSSSVDRGSKNLHSTMKFRVDCSSIGPLKTHLIKSKICSIRVADCESRISMLCIEDHKYGRAISDTVGTSFGSKINVSRTIRGHCFRENSFKERYIPFSSSNDY